MPRFPLLRFPPLSSGAMFSTPAFSTLATWCRVFHSHIFHSCVFSAPLLIIAVVGEIVCTADWLLLYSVSQKIPLLRFLDIFPNSWEFLVQILHAYYMFRTIYAKLQIFIQLPATLMKLCHIKRSYPFHIICSKCPPSAETHAGLSRLIWHNLVTVGDN